VPVKGASILVIIGVFKLLKSLSLLLLGLAALHLVHRDPADYIQRWGHYLHMDPNGRWINWVLNKAFFLSPRRLVELGVGLFVYSGLFFIEGIGLVLRQHWAEYFTTICTGLFIPMEIWEIARRIENHRRIAVPMYLTAINIAIVLYLIARLRREAVRRRTDSGGGVSEKT
jgi:uncharacterized membrane protein (DUF2068 family)